jgi:hypothetical protein
MTFVIPGNDKLMSDLRLPNTLTLAPDHTSWVVGHFLRKLYTDMLQDEFLERPRPLIKKLDDREQAPGQENR